MEWLVSLILLGAIGYLVWDKAKIIEAPHLAMRKRLCDYYAAGSVFEDIPTALKRGIRLLELHVYSDEQGWPVVAKHPLNQGYDYALDNVTFQQACIDIVNDAFPSPDPFILSINSHTENAVTLNRIADILKTTVHRQLVNGPVLPSTPLESLANKLVIVSGGSAAGTELDALVNMSWAGSSLRRLSYQQGVYPREEAELVGFNRDRISIVAPDASFGKTGANVDTPFAYGCQWNLFPSSRIGPGFVEKPTSLQGRA